MCFLKEVKKMKKKHIMISIVALTAILFASSMAALTQAGCFRNLPEYIAYSYKQDTGPSTMISMDDSQFPLIVVESTGTILAANITIGDKTYYYPNDFTYTDTLHIERNAITGQAFVRVHKVFTFSLKGSPTLESWLVTSMSGVFFDPNTGLLVDPANIRTDGQFRLTGTGRFLSVDGFGLEKDYYHFGFIKGWPLR
jgi:hypothetical protein